MIIWLNDDGMHIIAPKRYINVHQIYSRLTLKGLSICYIKYMFNVHVHILYACVRITCICSQSIFHRDAHILFGWSSRSFSKQICNHCWFKLIKMIIKWLSINGLWNRWQELISSYTLCWAYFNLILIFFCTLINGQQRC